MLSITASPGLFRSGSLVWLSDTSPSLYASVLNKPSTLGSYVPPANGALHGQVIEVLKSVSTLYHLPSSTCTPRSTLSLTLFGGA